MPKISVKVTFYNTVKYIKEGFDRLFGQPLEESSGGSKTFVVYNTACLGDVLLCNSLCQNIKALFPESRVIFVADRNWYDAAKYQKDVDDVVIYDKNGINKGFFGMLKFVRGFKYKNADVSIITYRHERNFAAAKLTQSKKVLLKSKNDKLSVQEEHNKELEKITNQNIQNYPIKYNVPDFAKESIKQKISMPDNYVVICTTGKRKEKDMPLNTAVELIKMFSTNNMPVVFTGAGDKSLGYAEDLKSAGCYFIDLTNKTTIPELAAVLENSKGLISIDTGTMHLGYAVGTPVAAVFYEPDYVHRWAPNPDLYKSIIVDSEQNADNIYSCATKLFGEVNE